MVARAAFLPALAARTLQAVPSPYRAVRPAVRKGNTAAKEAVPCRDDAVGRGVRGDRAVSAAPDWVSTCIRKQRNMAYGQDSGTEAVRACVHRAGTVEPRWRAKTPEHQGLPLRERRADRLAPMCAPTTAQPSTAPLTP